MLSERNIFFFSQCNNISVLFLFRKSHTKAQFLDLFITVNIILWKLTSVSSNVFLQRFFSLADLDFSEAVVRSPKTKYGNMVMYQNIGTTKVLEYWVWTVLPKYSGGGGKGKGVGCHTVQDVPPSPLDWPMFGGFFTRSHPSLPPPLLKGNRAWRHSNLSSACFCKCQRPSLSLQLESLIYSFCRILDVLV